MKNFPYAGLLRQRLLLTFTLGIFLQALLPMFGQTRYTPYRFITIAGSPHHYYEPENNDPALINIVGGYADAQGTNALFLWPIAVAVDRKRNIFVADASNGLLRRINPRLVTSTIAGQERHFAFADGVGTNAVFNNPVGLAVDRHGTVFVADASNNSIRQITYSNGEWIVSTVAGDKGATFAGGLQDGLGSEALFNQPTGIAIDGHGVIFVTDFFNNSIREIKRDGTNWIVSTIAGPTQIEEGDFQGRRGHADGIGTNALFNRPTAIATYRQGHLFVADSGNHVIRHLRRVTHAGVVSWEVTTIAGVPGSSGHRDGTATNALFDTPRSIAIQSSGAIFVGDAENFTIRRLTRSHGKWVVRSIGGTPGTAGFTDGRGPNALFGRTNVLNGALGQFSGLAVRGGSVFVADRFNSTIRRGRLDN